MTREDKLKKYLPKPRSKFLLVRCPKCANQQIIFSHASTVIKCLACGEILAKPTGGKAKIFAEVLEEYYE